MHFGGEKFRKIKDTILDGGEEAYIRLYNMGQKLKEKVLGGINKEETETGNGQSDGQNIYSASEENERITEEEQARINDFETHIDRVNRTQKELNKDNTNKTYGNPFKKKGKQNWLEKYTDSEGRTRALSRKRFFDQQKGVMLKGDNIRTRALRDIRNRLGLRRRRIYEYA